MLTDLSLLAGAVEEKRDENRAFLQFLKEKNRASPLFILTTVSEFCRDFITHFDCTTCGRCCCELSIPITPIDVRRLAVRLGLTDEQMAQKFFDVQKEGGKKTCPFLDKTSCSIYHARPAVCRQFPYLDTENLISSIPAIDVAQLMERTALCIIVFNAVEALKKELGFAPGGATQRVET